MSTVDFALVDVFADAPLSGNPLAVVPDADALGEDVLPRIAREFNQAETTFLVRPTVPGADHRLRSFTAGGVEVFGAGHNALGAWWWLADAGRVPDGRWHQQIGTAVLPVEVAGGTIAMRQEPVRFGSTVAPDDALAAALGLPPDDLSRVPLPQVTDTGAPHLLVGVRDRATVDRVVPDVASLTAILLAAGGEGCYVYALDSSVDAYTRFFNPVAGIVEDPATGTAAGPLACRLHRAGVVSSRAVFLQGQHLGRPSRIEISLDGDTPVIAGRAVLSATGTLRLP